MPLLPLSGRPVLSTRRARRPCRIPGSPLFSHRGRPPGTRGGSGPQHRRSLPVASAQAANRDDRPRARLRGGRERGSSRGPLHPPRTPHGRAGGAGPGQCLHSSPCRATSRGGAWGCKQLKEDQNNSPPFSKPWRLARPAIADPDPPGGTGGGSKREGPQAGAQSRGWRWEGAEPSSADRSERGGSRHFRAPRAGQALTYAASRRQGGQAARARCGEERRGGRKNCLHSQLFSHSQLCRAVLRPSTLYLQPGPPPAP